MFHLTLGDDCPVLRRKEFLVNKVGGVTTYTTNVASGGGQRQGTVARDRRNVWEAELYDSKDHTPFFPEVIRRPENLDKKAREQMILSKLKNSDLNNFTHNSFILFLSFLSLFPFPPISLFSIEMYFYNHLVLNEYEATCEDVIKN